MKTNPRVTVRSPEGEVQFASIEEARRAFRTGMIDATDEVFAPGAEQPARAVDLFGGKERFRWKESYDWYLLAPGVLGGAWFAGLLGLATATACFFIWKFTVRQSWSRRTRG